MIFFLSFYGPLTTYATIHSSCNLSLSSLVFYSQSLSTLVQIFFDYIYPTVSRSASWYFPIYYPCRGFFDNITNISRYGLLLIKYILYIHCNFLTLVLKSFFLVYFFFVIFCSLPSFIRVPMLKLVSKSLNTGFSFLLLEILIFQCEIAFIY